MRELKIYKCDYCIIENKSKKLMLEHEIVCNYNPINMNSDPHNQLLHIEGKYWSEKSLIFGSSIRKLKPKPNYKNIWTVNKMSKTIEHFLLSWMSISNIVLNNNNDDPYDPTYTIVDDISSEIVNTFTLFFNNHFNLTNLTKLTTLNGFCYEQLPNDFKLNFTNGQLITLKFNSKEISYDEVCEFVEEMLCIKN